MKRRHLGRRRAQRRHCHKRFIQRMGCAPFPGFEAWAIDQYRSGNAADVKVEQRDPSRVKFTLDGKRIVFDRRTDAIVTMWPVDA